MRPLFPTLVALLALTTGCLGASDAPVDPAGASHDDAAPSASPRPHSEAERIGGTDGAPVYARVESFEGTLTAAVGSVPLRVGGAQNAEYHEFMPGANATALVVELAWEGPLDLDLWVGPEDAGVGVGGNDGPVWVRHEEMYRDLDGAPGAPDAIARVDVTERDRPFDEPARWFAIATSKAGADVAFELKVTVFYGGAPPEGYSAFESRSA